MTDEITSPCVNICKVENGVCSACGRTLEHIARWGSMTEDERKKIIEGL